MRWTWLLTIFSSAGCLAAEWIVPGVAWYDTEGKKIDAHGGAVVRRGDVFYWIGYSASNQTPMFYSSTDLINWKNLGSQAPAVTGLWRPKIASPGGNESFWIYGQQDRYVLSLNSSSFLGGYKASAKVHLPPSDYTYSDTGMFFDEDSGVWYLLTSADHNTIQVNELEKSGKVGKRVSTLTGGAYEAPGIFKVKDTYFLIVSGKTGYRANPNKVFWATSLAGPWKGGSDIAPADKKTYGSQNTYEFNVKGTETTTYIYMGDAWDSKGGPSSNYTWLPMTVDASSKSVTLRGYSKWKIDVKTGVVTGA